MILVDNRGNTDPYINLAIEEFLVRNADCSKHDYLHLYINAPSVVVGKNQCIYKEINFDYLRNDKLKLARRISGGGTVYQDLGNLNFAFISGFTNQKINNYAHFNQVVVDALRKVDVDAVMDERNNILVQHKKISGNAQFTNRRNIISHGTLLFKADLVELRACLTRNRFEIETKAVNSVPSGIMNITTATDKFNSIGDFRQYLIEELTRGEVYKFSSEEWSEIERLAAEKFSRFEWIYGRTPHTKITKADVIIEVEHGIISKLESTDTSLQNLVGVNYGYTYIKKALEHNSNASEILNILF